MTPCKNCRCQPARRLGLCDPCYMHERRKGQPRPLDLVLRHLDRIVGRIV